MKPVVTRELHSRLYTWQEAPEPVRASLRRQLGEEQADTLALLTERFEAARDRVATLRRTQPLCPRDPLGGIKAAALTQGLYVMPQAARPLAKSASALIAGNVPGRVDLETRLASEWADLAEKEEGGKMANCAGGWNSSKGAFCDVAPHLIKHAPQCIEHPTERLPRGLTDKIADWTELSGSTIGFVLQDLRAGRTLANPTLTREQVEVARNAGSNGHALEPIEAPGKVAQNLTTGTKTEPPVADVFTEQQRQAAVENSLLLGRIRALLPAKYGRAEVGASFAQFIGDLRGEIREARAQLSATMQPDGGSESPYLPGVADQMERDIKAFTEALADRDGKITQLTARIAELEAPAAVVEPVIVERAAVVHWQQRHGIAKCGAPYRDGGPFATDADDATCPACLRSVFAEEQDAGAALVRQLEASLPAHWDGDDGEQPYACGFQPPPGTISKQATAREHVTCTGCRMVLEGKRQFVHMAGGCEESFEVGAETTEEDGECDCAACWDIWATAKLQRIAELEANCALPVSSGSVFVVVAHCTDKERIAEVDVFSTIEQARPRFAHLKQVYGGANVAMASRRVYGREAVSPHQEPVSSALPVSAADCVRAVPVRPLADLPPLPERDRPELTIHQRWSALRLAAGVLDMAPGDLPVWSEQLAIAAMMASAVQDI